MTGLSTLKLVSSQPVRKSSPREIRRQKLCKKLLEQLEMARCIKAGGSYEVIVTKRVRDEETGRRPPVFSSTGLWSPGGNLTGFESAFGHKPLGSVRPGISWVAPRCIPGAKLRRLRGHAPCW